MKFLKNFKRIKSISKKCDFTRKQITWDLNLEKKYFHAVTQENKTYTVRLLNKDFAPGDRIRFWEVKRNKSIWGGRFKRTGSRSCYFFIYSIRYYYSKDNPCHSPKENLCLTTEEDNDLYFYYTDFEIEKYGLGKLIFGMELSK